LLYVIISSGVFFIYKTHLKSCTFANNYREGLFKLGKYIFNFSELGEDELKDLNLHDGTIDVLKLIKEECSGYVDADSMEKIKKNGRADKDFAEWLNLNMSEEEITMLRVYFGRRKLKNFELITESDIGWNSTEDNRDKFEIMIERIGQALSCGCLGTTLTRA
jgi:hypothetical protein